jgi:polysaccharide chain length determinant protein (PEP-CTERM system associated)
MHTGPEGAHFTERLREVWSRRKWLAVIVFACAAAAGVTLAVSLPDMYRATATVLVEDPRVDATVATELDRRLQMITQEILSRKRLEEVIYRYDLYPRLREKGSPEAAVHQMRRDIRAQVRATSFTGSAGGTITLGVSYRGGDPGTVTRVVNTLAGFYLEQDRSIREREASGTVRQLAAQLQELKQTVDQQEREVASFQERHLGELPQQSEANLVALEQLQTELRATSEERMRALDRRNDLHRRLAELEGEEAGPSAGATRAGPGRLEKLRDELADLQRRFSDRYPDVIRLKAEIAALENQPAAVEAPPPAAVGPAVGRSGRAAARLRESLGEVERQVEAFKSDEARLRSGIGSYLQRLETAPRRQRAFEEVSRDYRTTRDLYDTLRKRYEQAQLEETTQRGDAGPRFRILDEAVVPAGPAAPNRQLLLLLAILGAVATAGAAALVAERLDTSFKSADDVRAFTTVPVLASIPRMATAGEVRTRRLRFLATAVSVLLAMGVVMKASRVVARNNDALVAMLARGQS